MKKIYDSTSDPEFNRLKRRIKQFETLAATGSADYDRQLNNYQVDFFNHIKKKIAEVLAQHAIVEELEEARESYRGNLIIEETFGYSISQSGINYRIEKVMDPATFDFSLQIEEVKHGNSELLESLERNSQYYGPDIAEALKKSRDL